MRILYGCVFVALLCAGGCRHVRPVDPVEATYEPLLDRAEIRAGMTDSARTGEPNDGVRQSLLTLTHELYTKLAELQREGFPSDRNALEDAPSSPGPKNPKCPEEDLKHPRDTFQSKRRPHRDSAYSPTAQEKMGDCSAPVADLHVPVKPIPKTDPADCGSEIAATKAADSPRSSN